MTDLTSEQQQAQLEKWSSFRAGVVGGAQTGKPFEPWRSRLPASQLASLFTAAGGLGAIRTQRFVEIGCATGETTVFAACNRVKSAVGVDVSAGAAGAGAGADAGLVVLLLTSCDQLVEETVAEARRLALQAPGKGDRAEFVTADVFDAAAMRDLGLFELLFDSQCYHCMQAVDEAKAVRAIAGLLRPGGLALVLTGNDAEPACGPAVLSQTQLQSAFEGSGGRCCCYHRCQSCCWCWCCWCWCCCCCCCCC